jgi:O-antigen biosynthesis protein WbqP
MKNRLIALLLLLLISPIVLLLLFITFIDIRDNPIFMQRRVVDGSKVFNFYKIRSMAIDAPLIPTPFFSDSKLYITKWGSFLRKSSLDELLNLISIINGDMNFIGPRPVMVEEFTIIESRKKHRIKSKGGITGFAQINGRDIITPNRKIAAEKYYESHKSLRLDIFIFFTTFKLVIKRSGVSH